MRVKTYADPRARNPEFPRRYRRTTVRSHHHIPEVVMNRTLFPFRNLAPLVTTVVAMVLLTATQAAAMQPPRDPGERTGTYVAPTNASAHHVTQSQVSALSWVMFAAAVLAALVIGAALMHLAQRRRVQLAH